MDGVIKKRVKTTTVLEVPLLVLYKALDFVGQGTITGVYFNHPRRALGGQQDREGSVNITLTSQEEGELNPDGDEFEEDF